MTDRESDNFLKDFMYESKSSPSPDESNIVIRKTKTRTARKRGTKPESKSSPSPDESNIVIRKSKTRKSKKRDTKPETKSTPSPDEDVKIVIRKKPNKFKINTEEVTEQIFNCIKDLGLKSYRIYENNKWSHSLYLHGDYPTFNSIIGVDALKKHINIFVKGIALLVETKPGFLHSINSNLLKIKKAYDDLEDLTSIIEYHRINKLGTPQVQITWQGPTGLENAWYADMRNRVEVLKTCLSELFIKIRKISHDANELRIENMLKYQEITERKGEIYDKITKNGKKPANPQMIIKAKQVLKETVDIYTFLQNGEPYFHSINMEDICTVYNPNGNNFIHLSFIQDTCIPKMRKYTKCILSMFNILFS
jgi:hypothetical protein